MVLRKFVLVVLFAASAVSASAQQPAQQPAQPAADPSQLFGVRESVQQIDISPDGLRVVFLQPGPGRTTGIYVHELASSSEPRLVVHSDGDPERFRWCNFVTNDRLICQIGGMVNANGMLIPFSRLISMDLDGRNLTRLGQAASAYDARVRQFDGSVLDWSGGEAGSILMIRDIVPEQRGAGTRLARAGDGLAVDRVDVRTLRTQRVEQPNSHAEDYISDGRGNVRIMSTLEQRSDGQAGTRITYLYRTAASRDWRAFSIYDAATGTGMYPVAVDAQLDAAYVLQKLDGRYALYRVKLDGSLATELVHANDRVDVDGVVWASRRTRVIGVTFADEQQRVVYFDSAYATLARSLARSIPTLPMIDFGATSADGNRVLVHAGADNDAGRYYLYDRTARNLNEILAVRPQLEGTPLASVRSVTYPAADGTPIPAYLTLPPGRETARGLPAVILPHGGPSSRDVWGFDWLAQYLANRGYAVLQANYRGSAGYGDRWLQRNGFQSWRTSIGDIDAGARWLAAQGIGDPARMAILGWSYGGYAALQAGATEPGLYKAIVAIAPVTDLQQIKDDARNYTSARNVAEYIGSGPHIAQGSPLRNAAAITAPVLLFHGDRDLNVSVTHSRRMNEALRGAGKRSELVEFRGLEHDLADSAVRQQMLERIGTFLQAALGAPQ
jgi:dipeptidyl aminopeptidase/acylaminoacyl peptidase